MKKENLEKAKIIHEAIEHHEDFISNCDYALRNKEKNDGLYVDHFFINAQREGVLKHDDLLKLILDLRDIATTRLGDLDKQLEAL